MDILIYAKPEKVEHKMKNKVKTTMGDIDIIQEHLDKKDKKQQEKKSKKIKKETAGRK